MFSLAMQRALPQMAPHVQSPLRCSQQPPQSRTLALGAQSGTECDGTVEVSNGANLDGLTRDDWNALREALANHVRLGLGVKRGGSGDRRLGRVDIYH